MDISVGRLLKDADSLPHLRIVKKLLLHCAPVAHLGEEPESQNLHLALRESVRLKLWKLNEHQMKPFYSFVGMLNIYDVVVMIIF